MDNILKPSRFETLPDAPSAAKDWLHWLTTFNHFIEEAQLTDQKKLKVLVNYLSSSVYDFISECTTLKSALKVLSNLYVKPTNEIFARYLLSSRKQLSNESVDQYLQHLKTLGRDCNFTAVSAAQNRDDCIRDAFVKGLISSDIRQKLLENSILSLEEAATKARAIESSVKQSQLYCSNNPNLSEPVFSSSHHSKSELTHHGNNEIEPVSALHNRKCYFCGSTKLHPRFECPARDSMCSQCKKKGHFSKVCMSGGRRQLSSAHELDNDPCVATVLAASPAALAKAVIPAQISGIRAHCLIDTGSSSSYINEEFAQKHKFSIVSTSRDNKIIMASTNLSTTVKGFIIADLELQGFRYRSFKLSVLPNLCADILVGHDIMQNHTRVDLTFGGNQPPLSITAVTQAAVEPVRLFTNLDPKIRPIATKSKKHSLDDLAFIKAEVQQLLNDSIIEESVSPWRAQLLVVKGENRKRRMVINYAQTINKFTFLDAYPLPNIDDMVSEIAKFSVFSTLDLKSAYHQVPIAKDDRPYTAFEADGNLYQFKVIAFGLTNGVSGFQRFINKIISTEQLKGVRAYIDDVTVFGHTQEEHDQNLKAFFDVAKKYKLTINRGKCQFSRNSIILLGHLISNHEIRPDPERLKPLLEMPPPNSNKSLQRLLGLFAHYSKWIPNFSSKIRPLVVSSFPLSNEAIQMFEKLKQDIASSVITTIEHSQPLIVETDASDSTLAATLSQNQKPVAFFSRTLSNCEKSHSAIEKEAAAIVECLRKWRHFLIGHHFKLITDQEALSFVFDMKHSSKIKNDKIMRWRLELSEFSFDIIYRPGKNNTVADTLSRICSSVNYSNTAVSDRLRKLHEHLSHPGVTRLNHFVRTRNLNYSLEEIRRVTSTCPICAEIKPRFFRKPEGVLIKATQPFERLSVDFKGPLPTHSGRPFLLTMVDEYSRFPFAFPCKDMSAKTVIKCFSDLFLLFGTPGYVHSDRGTSFLSKEVTTYLHNRGTATSHSTPYHPQGNGQIEKFNGTIWRAVCLNLKTKGMSTSQWEAVLGDSLHSIRSLLCTATNATPHERMFIHQRRSTNGSALPSWLMSPGIVLLRKHVRTSKYDPVVEQVELLEANPQYALIRYADGRESNVALHDLAPAGDLSLFPSDDNRDSSPQRVGNSSEEDSTTEELQRADRPRRNRRPPDFFHDYVGN